MSQPPYGPSSGPPYPSSEPPGAPSPYGPEEHPAYRRPSVYDEQPDFAGPSEYPDLPGRAEPPSPPASAEPRSYPDIPDEPEAAYAEDHTDSPPIAEEPSFTEEPSFAEPDTDPGTLPAAAPPAPPPAFPSKADFADDTGGTGKRRILVGLAIVVILAVGGVGAWLILDRDTDDASSASTAATDARSAGPTTSGPTTPGPTTAAPTIPAATPEAAAGAFYAAMQAEKYDEVVSQACSTAPYTLEKFTAEWRPYYAGKGGGVASWSVTSSTAGTNPAGISGTVVSANITFEDGTVEADSNLYVDEDGGWRFCGPA